MNSTSSDFEKMCNYVAVMRSVDSAELVSGLITYCLADFADESMASVADIQSVVDEICDVKIPEEEIQPVMEELLRDGIVRRGENGRFGLDLNKKREVLEKIQSAHDLESSVKENWKKSVSPKKDLSVELNDVWDCLHNYLMSVFRIHGMRAVELLGYSSGVEQTEQGLSDIVKESTATLSPEDADIASGLIQDFVRNTDQDEDRAMYVSQLADGAFNFYAMSANPRVVEVVQSKIRKVNLFFDTNTLIALLNGADYMTRLVEAISKHNLPFKLRYHSATAGELKVWIKEASQQLRQRPSWPQHLSAAAVNSQRFFYLEEAYHRKNAVSPISVERFLRPFDQFASVLEEKGFSIYRPDSPDAEAERILSQRLDRFLRNPGRRKKLRPQLEHDVQVLATVRAIRSQHDRTAIPTLFVTQDRQINEFEHLERGPDKSRVVLPTALWQILRSIIPRSKDFDKAFANAFSLPEIRVLAGSQGAAASWKLLELLATSDENISEALALQMITNEHLLDELKNTTSTEEFSATVEQHILSEINQLHEVNESLNGATKQQANRIASLEDQVNEKALLAEELNTLREDLNRKEKTLGVFVAMSLGSFSAGATYFAVDFAQFAWLLAHKNVSVLVPCFSALIGVLTASVVKQTRNAFLPIALTLFAACLGLLSF